MSDFTNEVIVKVNELQERIDKKRKIIAFSRVLNEKKFNKLCSAIFDVQAIISECLQYGNYRRACRYIIVANEIINQIEQREIQIINKLTSIIVED